MSLVAETFFVSGIEIQLGWKHKSNRIIADELAFANQVIVIVPDIHRGNSWSDLATSVERRGEEKDVVLSVRGEREEGNSGGVRTETHVAERVAEEGVERAGPKKRGRRKSKVGSEGAPAQAVEGGRGTVDATRITDKHEDTGARAEGNVTAASPSQLTVEGRVAAEADYSVGRSIWRSGQSSHRIFDDAFACLRHCYDVYRPSPSSSPSFSNASVASPEGSLDGGRGAGRGGVSIGVVGLGAGAGYALEMVSDFDYIHDCLTGSLAGGAEGGGRGGGVYSKATVDAAVQSTSPSEAEPLPDFDPSKGKNNTNTSGRNRELTKMEQMTSDVQEFMSTLDLSDMLDIEKNSTLYKLLAKNQETGAVSESLPEVDRGGGTGGAEVKGDGEGEGDTGGEGGPVLPDWLVGSTGRIPVREETVSGSSVATRQRELDRLLAGLSPPSPAPTPPPSPFSWLEDNDPSDPEDTSSSPTSPAHPLPFASQPPQLAVSFTREDLLALRPRGVLALCPGLFDVTWVGSRLKSPAFLVYAAEDGVPGARLEDAQRLCSSLYRRREDVTDFCVRVYEGRRGSFVSEAVEEVDRRCAQDAIGLGGMWMDIYCRDTSRERTQGFGRTKSSSPFVYIPMKLMRRAAKNSLVATHVHDDADFF
eukprot:gene428-453_t